MSPSTRAPDATAGRLEETTSPPTVAPSSIVARPFNATTLSSTFPRTRTSPLNATTEPFTCPSITAGPWKITTLSVCSCAPTSTRPVMTTRAPSSLPLVCAAAGCASSPTRHASVASARPTARSALCEELIDPATAAPPRVARRHRRRRPVFVATLGCPQLLRIGRPFSAAIVSGNVRVSGVRCASDQMLVVPDCPSTRSGSRFSTHGRRPFCRLPAWRHRQHHSAR